jgi:putative ABC transport system permease protein
MSGVRVLLARLRALFVRRRLDDALDEELRAHLAMLEDDYVRAGMSPEDARRKARLRLGGIEQTKEVVRDQRATWIDSVWQDVRYALRTFRRSPAFTAVAVLTLALGIGINSTIFSLADGVLFRPLPYRDPGRLFLLSGVGPPEHVPVGVAHADIVEWKHRNHTCDDIAFVGSLWTFRHADADRFGVVTGMPVSGNFFSVLGVHPVLGRMFSDGELRAGGEPVAVITQRLWTSEFGGDPNVIGRMVKVRSRLTVVGVMPDGFQFPTRPGLPEPDILLPMVVTAPEEYARHLHAVARLKRGVSVEAAEADLNAITRQLMPQWSLRSGKRDTGLAPFERVALAPLSTELAQGTRPTALSLFLAVSVLLLIATANLANLVLARGTDRQRELTVRAAIGAGRTRLARQLLSESILLAVAGGAAGFLLAAWTIALLRPLVPRRLHLLKDVGIDGRMLIYTALVSLITAIAFGIAPALRFSRPEVAASLTARPLRPGPRRRFHSALVFVEVALVIVVLAAGGLLVSSYLRLKVLDPGYRPKNVLLVHVYPDPGGRSLNELLDAIRVVPGVRSVAAADEGLLGIDRPILSREMKRTSFAIDGLAQPSAGDRSTDIVATPGYFETMGMRLVKGRLFTERDGLDDPPVAIVSESMARRFGPDENPIGRRVRYKDEVREIVGVVGDVRDIALDRPPERTVYLPYGKNLERYAYQMTLVVRSEGDLQAVRGAVLGRLRQVLDARMIGAANLLDDLLGRSVAERTFNTLLFAVFALTALGLCATGIYGVVSYAVARRTHEIGVRVALGAARGQVVRMIVGQAMVPVIGGLVVGLAAAFGATRLLRSLLFQVTPTDPLTFAAVTLVLLVAALFAAYVPARRATRIDPMTALRCE